MSNICSDLRKSILRSAIQGKLISHVNLDVRPILDEANIKYDQDEAYPFDIPETWAWVKLKSVASVIYGYPFNSQLFNKDEKGMPLIRIRDILPAESKTYTTETAPDSYVVIKGDMLVGMDGNFNVNFWNSESAYLNQRCCKITAGDMLDQRLLFWFLPVFLDDIFENVSYTTVKHLSDKHLTRMSIPLPPLTEQKRIVEKIDELMARVADLEQSADALTSLKRAFPDDIKASLLQYAMQGKLTKQLPEDGDAEDLLEEIKAKKEKLITESKIKKQKPLAPIKDDEIPFSIPENWKWVRLLDICEQIGDIDHNMPKATSKDGIPFLSAKDICDDFSLNFNKDVKEISIEDYERLGRKMKPQKNDIIFSRIGSLGKTAVVDTDKKFLVSYSCCIMRPITIDLKFFAYYLICPIIQSHIMVAKTGIGVPDLGMGEIKACLMPLPPIAEQKRIVERLEKLMQNINAVGELIASE